MEKIKKYFYEETGMFVDWPQLNSLPSINTFIDVGVGADGTPEFYERFPEAKLLLIDPLEESKLYAERNLENRDYTFYQYAVGDKDKEELINIEEEIGRSTILNVTELNYEGPPIRQQKIEVKKLDNIIKYKSELGDIGMKIDTEGYELNVILGASEILKKTKFVVAEVRHNKISFDGQYNLKDFVLAMHENRFVLTRIITAKPLIADLCFEPY